MSIPSFIHARRAAAAIAACLIVAFADPANSSEIETATGPTDPLCGTTGKIGAEAAGDMVDRSLGGIAAVGQLQLLQPFFGLALAATLLHEEVSPAMIAITLVVVLCVAGARKFAR